MDNIIEEEEKYVIVIEPGWERPIQPTLQQVLVGWTPMAWSGVGTTNTLFL